MPRLPPDVRLHRLRAADRLRQVADLLTVIRHAHGPYLPRSVVAELVRLHGPAYRLSRLLDPTLLEADRSRWEKLVARARVAGSTAPQVAGLTLEELAELLAGRWEMEPPEAEK